MSPPPQFDPYALFEALDRERFGYVVVGAFARVMHGTAETTRGLDIVRSMREETLRRLVRVLEDLEATANRKPVRIDQLAGAERMLLKTRAGELSIVATPRSPSSSASSASTPSRRTRQGKAAAQVGRRRCQGASSTESASNTFAAAGSPRLPAASTPTT